MIAVEKAERASARCHGVVPAVTKRGRRKAPSASADEALMSNSAQHHNGPKLGQSAQTPDQKPAACGDFRRSRLVFRRYAANRIADDAIDQLQAVIGPFVVVADREPKADQSFIKKVAGPISGERASGSVRAIQARRQSKDEETRLGGSERADRRVVARRVSRAIRQPVIDQARAEGALGGGLGPEIL